MPTYLTCTVVETAIEHAFEMGVALRLGTPEGTSLREDPHVPDVFYLEAAAEVTDLPTALVSAGLAAAALVTATGLPGEVVEVVAVDADGAVCWVPTPDAIAPATDTTAP